MYGFWAWKYPYLEVPKLRMDQQQFQQGITRGDPNALPKDLGVLYRDMHPQLLADQLIQLGLFATLRSPEDIARHNYAVEMLCQCGLLQTEVVDGRERITLESMTQAVNNLLGIVPLGPEQSGKKE